MLVGPEGFVGKYRKAHLNAADALYLTPGQLPLDVYETALGNIGLMLGDDVLYPEIARVYLVKGAAIVATGMSNSGTSWPEHARTRSSENKVYVLATNYGA